MDLPIDIIDATNRFQETVIEVCETVNWKHDQVTYCSYNSKGAVSYTHLTLPTNREV